MNQTATPAATGYASEILSFLESLRSEIPLSPHQALAVHELLLQIVRLDKMPANLRDLAEMVAPVVCSNEQEQEQFYRRLNTWIAERANPPPIATRSAEHALQPAAAAGMRFRKWVWIGLAAAVVLLVALTSLFTFQAARPEWIDLPSTTANGPVRLRGTVLSQGREVANATLWFLKQKTRTGTDGRFDAVPSPPPEQPFSLLVTHNDFYARLITIDPANVHADLLVEVRSKSRLPTGEDLPGVPQMAVVPQPVSPLSGTMRSWLILLASAIPLAVLLVLAIQRMRITKWTSPLEQRARSTKLPVPARQLDPREKVRRILQFLRRPHALERIEIAPAATAIATARAAGYFSPRYMRQRQSPAYLVAIDQAGPGDQLAVYHEAMMRAVERESGIRDLFEIRRVALSAPVLLRLAGLYPDRIVWAFAEPDALRNPFGSGPAEWLRLLGHWPSQLLLSPLARFGWTEAHWKRWGLDLAVAPPTLDGILSWASQRPRWAPHDRWQLGPYPPLLRELPEMWLTGAAPAPRVMAQLSVQLRGYLGRDGFTCLAACAIFPTLSWEATLNCVMRLVTSGEGPLRIPPPHGFQAGSDAAAVLDPRASEILERLVRLPWLRQNRMPQWLRERLAEALPAADAAIVRGMLEELIARIDTAQSGGASLVSRFLRRDRPRVRRRKGAAQDYVLLSFLWKRFSDRLALAAPGWFQRFRLRHGLFLKPMVLPAALCILLSAGLGLLASRIPADTLPRVVSRVIPVPSLQPAPASGSPAVHDAFLARVLDVAASQVGVTGNEKAWATPFVTWAFQQTATIVAGDPVTVVAATTEEEQWTNALKDPRIKVYQAGQGTRPEIEPGFVFAHRDPAGLHVGIVESVSSGQNLSTLEPGVGATIIRRYRDARKVNVGFIDYARSLPRTPTQTAEELRELIKQEQLKQEQQKAEQQKATPVLNPPDKPLRTLEGHSGPVYAVAATPDGKRAISGSADRTLKVWDLYTGRALHTLEGHSADVYGVAVTPDGNRAVSASADRTLKVWDLDTGRALRTLQGHSNAVEGVAVTPDGKWAVSASSDATLKVWDLDTGLELRTLEGHSGHVDGVAVTADGRRAVSASGDRTLKVWNLDTGRALRTLPGHSATVQSVAVTADGKRAVSASFDRTLKVWDLDTGLALRTLQGHSNMVWGVAVTADGKRAVSASGDGTLKVWDLDTGRALRTLQGHSASVQSVAVTPDGRMAISGSEDKTLKVWDLEAGPAAPPAQPEKVRPNKKRKKEGAAKKEGA